MNIVLDPLFILDELPFFGIRGFGLGATGAALATVIGQAVGCVLAVLLNTRYNADIRLRLRSFKPDWKIIGGIYAIGVPSIIMVSIGSVMYYLMNMILMGVSSYSASIFGVYFKLQSFVFMPLFGMNNGVIPIIAYNFGAKRRRRMLQTTKFAMLYAFGFMAAGTLLMQLIPDVLLRLFIDDSAVIALGCTALRIISIGFALAGFGIVISSVFQALGHGFYSMLVSIVRQLLVLIPVAYLLSLSGNLDLIWWSFPIAEIASVIVSALLYIRLYKKTIRHIPLG